MKRCYIWMLAAVLLCGPVVSCNKDNPAPEPPVNPQPIPPFTPDEGKYLRTLDSDESKSYVTILYTGMGSDGTLKEMSELICYPDLSDDKKPANLGIGCHITITSDAQRPSNYRNLSAMTDVFVFSQLLVPTGTLVVMPDYEGYGSTGASPHPYLQRDVTARQVIAGAMAALQWLQQEKGKTMADGWKSVAFGYSQGGAVAASVLRYYQENRLDGLNLSAAACGDGPYDPMATLGYYIKDNKLYMPVSPALVLKGFVDCNAEMKQLGCTYADFMTEGFIQTGIFDELARKEKDTDAIHSMFLQCSREGTGQFTMTVYNKVTETFLPYNAENTLLYPDDSDWELGNSSAKSYCTADQCFKAGVIAYFRDGTVEGDVPEAKLKALKSALENNSLTSGGWQPSQNIHPSFSFFHSAYDEVVPIANYEKVKESWGIERIKGYRFTPNNQTNGTHLNTGMYYVLMGPSSYIKKMFDGSETSGEQIVTD